MSAWTQKSASWSPVRSIMPELADGVLGKEAQQCFLHRLLCICDVREMHLRRKKAHGFSNALFIIIRKHGLT